MGGSGREGKEDPGGRVGGVVEDFLRDRVGDEFCASVLGEGKPAVDTALFAAGATAVCAIVGTVVGGSAIVLRDSSVGVAHTPGAFEEEGVAGVVLGRGDSHGFADGVEIILEFGVGEVRKSKCCGPVFTDCGGGL